MELKWCRIVMVGCGLFMILMVCVMSFNSRGTTWSGLGLSVVTYIAVSNSLALNIFGAQDKRIRALEERLADETAGRDKE